MRSALTRRTGRAAVLLAASAAVFPHAEAAQELFNRPLTTVQWTPGQPLVLRLDNPNEHWAAYRVPYEIYVVGRYGNPVYIYLPGRPNFRGLPNDCCLVTLPPGGTTTLTLCRCTDVGSVEFKQAGGEWTYVP